MKSLNCLFLLIILSVATSNSKSTKFYVIRQWKYINFTWPDEDTLKTATSKGLYIPENTVISGVKYYDDYFYLTLPRMKSGVPATLARIKAGHVRDYSPDLEPFPSWEMNDVEDCNNLQNVQNVEIDTKGQMWIIDGGRVQTLMNPIVKCAPKLIIYSISDKRVVTVYQFTEDVAPKNGSFLYDLVVDQTEGGFAYITDNSAHDPGVIVYSVKENRAWKIRDPRTMQADPTATQFNVNEISIDAPINIAGIALGPKIHTSNDKVVVNEDREVYYCPLSSLHLYSINTTVLRNENLAKNLTGSVKDIGLKPSQTVGMVMDNQGVLYYTLLGNTAVGKWDSHTPFESTQQLIAKDSRYLEWPNSLAFDRAGNLTVLVNRLNKFIFGKLDLNEYNFRLISAFVDGTSYLYDNKFDYDFKHDHDIPPTSSEPEPSAKPEPHSEPEPSPEPASQPHDHEHEHNHDHSAEKNKDVIITKGTSSGSRFLTSILSAVVGVFAILL